MGGWGWRGEGMVCRAPKEEPAAAIGVDTEHKGDALSAQVRSECLGGRRGERCCGRDVFCLGMEDLRESCM